MSKLLALATAAFMLSACQGLVNPAGQFTGITVPPGCKASGQVTFPIAQGGFQFVCDETGAPASASGARIQLR